jgi:hypothetical protein
MGRIAVFTNPLDPLEVVEYKYSGIFIDWLVAKYPEGFPGDHQVSFNLRKLEVRDYDISVGKNDIVSLVVFPADPIVTPLLMMTGVFTAGSTALAVTSAIISTALMIGLSYGLNALFGPKSVKPKAADNVAGNQTSPSAVYTISGSANQARVGQTIPVAYGTNLLVPDVASQGFTYYKDNDQFAVILLCLGQGRFDIHEVSAAGTNAENINSIYSYVQYSPERHNKTFGTIQGQYPSRFENMYTSPEVSGQELDNNKGKMTGLVSMADLWKGTSDGVNASWFYLDEGTQVFADGVFNGDAVWLTIDYGLNSQFVSRVDFIYHSNSDSQALDDSPNLRFRKGFIVDDWPFQNGREEVAITFYEPPLPFMVNDLPIGPFAACPAGAKTSQLQYDIVYPSGLFKSTSSDVYGPFSVAIDFKAEPIDDCGKVIGQAITLEYNTELATPTPQRQTLTHLLPEARYQVTTIRKSGKSLRPNDPSTVVWAGLKSVLGNTLDSDECYGDVTLVSIEVKATQGLSSDAMSRVRVCATRVDDNGVPISNPADVFTDILTNQRYGGRRPISEVDALTLDELRTKWKGRTVDTVYDQQTSLWDALGTSIQMQSAVPVTRGATVSIVEDKAQQVASASLNTDQIASLTLTHNFVQVNDYDGVQGEYRNGVDNAPLYALWPEDSTDPEKLTLWGCKQYDNALNFVKRFWRQKVLRRRMITLETELDGRNFYLGQAVNITHPLLSADRAVMVIVSAIKPAEEVKTTVEAYIYEHDVFTNNPLPYEL